MIDLNELERLEREATAGPWRDDNGLRVYAPDPDPAMMSDDHESLLFSTKHTAAKSADSPLCAALRNAARELIADAKRYRWLRDKAWSVGHSAPAVCMVDESGRPYLDMDNFAADPIMEGRELDLNIDAAIAKEKQ